MERSPEVLSRDDDVLGSGASGLLIAPLIFDATPMFAIPFTRLLSLLFMTVFAVFLSWSIIATDSIPCAFSLNV